MRPGSNPARAHRPALKLERLEDREVPATLAPIADFTTPATKALYVPLTVTGVAGTVQYIATSSNSQVQAQVVQGGTTIRMTVTGTAAGGTFQGDLTFRLFDSLAPVTTARIVSLVRQGFYDGLTFHRVLDGFVAQGGDPDGDGTGGSGVRINDEFDTLLTFNSPGLLAMANSGDDTGDSQFFITDTDVPPLGQPQHLNFNHTIFGQLVAGFDTFAALMRTPVNSPQVGRPVGPVTIQSAAVVADDPNGVLRVTAPPNFTGTATITVTPSDGGASTGDTFNVTFVADTRNEPPFLGPVGDQSAAVGTGVSFTLTSTDLERDPVTYSFLGATSGGQSIGVQPRIDPATGRVTVTPPAAFSGLIDLRVGVRDAGGTNDTQVIRLAVAGNFDLDTASDTGVLNDDNATGRANPTLTVLASAGQTVAVTVNGTAAGTATPTSTPGRYQITIPTGRLRVGANTIAGTATPAEGSAADLAPFTLNYTPSLREVYVVPGEAGAPRQITFQFASSESVFRNEFGFFRADDASGRVGNLSPGDAGYAAAALARRRVVFARGASVGTATDVTANGGEVLVPYIVQNGTSASLVAANAGNGRTGTPVAFFGLTAANPDGIAHLSAADEPAGSRVTYAFEDLTGGGDRDYNDTVVTVRRAGDAPPATLRVPGEPGRAVSVTARLRAATKADTNPNPTTTNTAGGEVGVIVADDAAGRIGNLNPGGAGYAAAALAKARVLFAQGTATGQSTTLNRSGGEFLVFYFVPNGTAAAIRTDNPTNNPTNGRVAFFSLPAANPDDAVHARSFNPEGVTRAAPTADEPYTVHMMGRVNGGQQDFDDVAFTVRFGS